VIYFYSSITPQQHSRGVMTILVFPRIVVRLLLLIGLALLPGAAGALVILGGGVLFGVEFENAIGFLAGAAFGLVAAGEVILVWRVVIRKLDSLDYFEPFLKYE
jgi:hypothetical protein